MKKTIAMLIIVFIALSNVIIFGADTDNLNIEKGTIQSQLEEENKVHEEINIKITKQLEQINSLNERIDQYEKELREANIDINKLNKEIQQITKKLKVIEKNYEIQKKAFENRLVVLYESGDIRYLDFILNSNSLTELVSNYFLISELAAYDSDIVDSIYRQKNALDTTRDSLKERRDALAEIKTNKEKTIISIKNAKVIRNSYLAELTKEEKKSQAKIDEFREELNRIDTELAYITSQDIDFEYVGGVFAWPVPGYRTVTSTYGMRMHPIFKVWRMHSGTDIGAPMGVNIIAVNDGVVTKAGYSTGYGNMVTVNHGGGISTVYGHGSEIIAKVGDHVKRGDVIMKVGSTGWSTGPHLHFEVWINGHTVDSLPYITGGKK